MHEVGLCERDAHRYFVTASEHEHCAVIIRVVLSLLADDTAQTAHDRFLVDVCVMTHKESVPCIIEELAVHEVVASCANHKEAVADEFDTTGYVA